jgi:LysR family transcriptional regulator, regulator for genes of the gallate degradation pathway
MTERAPNIRHYAALAATVRQGSVSRAARAINLSQPALTQAIAALESSLGVTLFERGASGMTPTEPALLLAPRAEAAIEHIGSPRVTGTQLRAFLAVVRGGTYAAAAEATGLSPASLHRAVADLSVALGQRLFDRRGRSLILTPSGARRARAFGLAAAELRAGISEVTAWLGQAGGRIVIGAMPLSRARWLPEAIQRFRVEHNAIDIAVLEGSYSELAGPLRDGEIDMLLGALREELPPDLSQEPAFEDQPALIMRAGHPILARDDIARAMLDYPWLLPDRSTPLRRYWEAMLSALELPVPHVAIECGSVIMIRQLLIAGDALTLLSPDQVAVELDAGILAALPPPVPVNRTIGIITRTGWRPTLAEAALVEKLHGARPPLKNDS